MGGLKSASSFTAGVWRRNAEKWRLYMTSGDSKRELADREEAATGINPLVSPDRQLETAADLLPDGHEDVQCDSG
jgi:hypothetical protein